MTLQIGQLALQHQTVLPIAIRRLLTNWEDIFLYFEMTVGRQMYWYDSLLTLQSEGVVIYSPFFCCTISALCYVSSILLFNKPNSLSRGWSKCEVFAGRLNRWICFSTQNYARSKFSWQPKLSWKNATCQGGVQYVWYIQGTVRCQYDLIQIGNITRFLDQAREISPFSVQNPEMLSFASTFLKLRYTSLVLYGLFYRRRLCTAFYFALLTPSFSAFSQYHVLLMLNILSASFRMSSERRKWCASWKKAI